MTRHMPLSILEAQSYSVNDITRYKFLKKKSIFIAWMIFLKNALPAGGRDYTNA